MQEDKLVKQCKKGNAAAQKQLVDKYSKYLYNVCHRYTKDPAFAYDCLQESWILIFNKLDLFRAEGNFKSWATVVTVRKTISLLKKYKMNTWKDIDITPEASCDESVHYKLEWESVQAFIQSLDENYRVVINMYLVEGFSHREIAEALDIKESSSRSLLARARKKIKENFESVENYELRNAMSALVVGSVSSSKIAAI